MDGGFSINRNINIPPSAILIFNEPPNKQTFLIFTVYIENGRKTTAATLAFTIGTGGSGKWSTKVSQIECTSYSRAYPGKYSKHTFLGGPQGAPDPPNPRQKSLGGPPSRAHAGTPPNVILR